MKGSAEELMKESVMRAAAVVPVYNVERYLAQCVDSLLSQTCAFSAIVLVDDGSTDASGALCDRYAAGHGIVSVVHKRNEGLGLARNTGLDFLGGDADYVMFVDSDDWLEPDALERLVAATDGGKVDCVIGGYTKKDVAGGTRFVLQLENAAYSGEEVRDRLVPRLCGSAPELSDAVPMSACSSLFRLGLVEERSLRFPSEREMISEDFVFKFRFLLASKRVAVSDFTQYCYRTSVGSLTTSYRVDRFEASLRFYQEVLKAIRAEDLSGECVLRLQKTLFIYLRMCVKQERPRISGKKFSEGARTIARELADPKLQEALSLYPVHRLGCRQRLFVDLVRQRCSRVLLVLAQIGLL